MKPVRFGVVGLGNMGSQHIRYLSEGKIEGAVLGAYCDIDPAKLEAAKAAVGGQGEPFADYSAMLDSGLVDAAIIAVPHYLHPPMAIEAFSKGIHVLTEKPAGVYTKQVYEMNAAAEKSGLVFGIMYNQRTNPRYQKIRSMVQGGELGDLKRVVWIITDWYRSQSYYNSGGWRATWGGEGGGVLINQCPHNLDLWQWITGMPVRMRAFMSFGKYHDIEVEDDVTAYFEYANGATGVFATTTGEYPGTNRLEISGTMGKVVYEEGVITFYKNKMDEREFNRTFKGGFGGPEFTKEVIQAEGAETAHAGITQNFTDAVLKGAPLLAPGREGVNGLNLSNAMHLSAFLGKEVEIPVDPERYYAELQKRIQTSTYHKVVEEVQADFEASRNRY